MKYVLLAGCLALSGCIPYPVYKQLQPDTLVHVVDRSGAPIAGAQVILLANTYPYGREHHRELQTTDATGSVAFKARHEWRAESLIIHGSQVFFWNLCICVPGYATYSTRGNPEVTFDTDSTVVLQPGTPTACPSVKENS